MSFYELIIERDEDLRTRLDEFMLESGLDHIYISGAVGSIKDLVLAAPASFDIPPQLVLTPCAGPAEITGFSGDVYLRHLAPEDELFLDNVIDSPLFAHIHMSCATAGGKAYGGGFRQGKAFRRIKLFIWNSREKP